MELLDTEQKIKLNAYLQDLHKEYINWQYWQSRKQLQDSLFYLYERLAPKIELQYKVGELDFVDFELFQSEKVSINQSQNHFQQELMQSEWQLRKTAYLNDSIQLNFSKLQILPLIQFDTINETALYLIANKNEIDMLEREIKFQKVSARQTGLHAGYFAQSLEGDYLFQGISAGIQIPD